MKYIVLDFCSDALAMPQGWDMGVPGVPRVKIFFFEHGHVAYQIEGDNE